MSGRDAVPGVEPLSCSAVRDRDLIAHYLGNELPPGEAEALEAHFFACDDCWGRVRAVLSLRADARGATAPPGEEVAHPAARGADVQRGGSKAAGPAAGPIWTGVGLDRRLRRWAAVAVAAGIAGLAFGVWAGPAMEQARRTGGDGPAADGAYRGGGGEVTLDVARSAGGLALSWTPVEETHHYLVRFYTAEGAVAAEERAEEPGLEVPAEALPADASLFVMVEARNAAGRVVARSSPVPVSATEP